MVSLKELDKYSMALFAFLLVSGQFSGGLA